MPSSGRGLAAVWLLLAVAALGTGQELKVGKSSSNPCINVDTCGACIRTARACAWCAAEVFPRSSSRCDVHDHLKTTCPKESLVYPQSTMLATQNDKVRGGDGIQQPIQVQPQELNITARTNEPISFQLTFRQAENYPVDLYFLLDLSYSMVKEEEARQRLVSLGKDIPQSMENITQDFYLGFGTFVDKTVMPYVAWTDELLSHRCPFSDKSCRPPHDFINQLKLSKDGSTAFANKMKDALNIVSQSIDDSEGGLDGLVQALACETQIGWRERSRRIIVYSSNSLFHIAGDGLLGGATKNNDGKCHLNSQGSYSPCDVDFDFPSVSQIAGILQEKSASVIFAVMPSVLTHYERFRSITGSAEIGQLEDKSSNIIKLIRSNYDKLRSRIYFEPKQADGIEFKFKSKCKGKVVRETAICESLEIKENVTFDVSMTVSSDVCEGRTGIVDRSVELAAQGLKEKLTINLRIICDCECEHPPLEQPNSKKCGEGNGTFECGICSCNPGRYGRDCECSESEITSEESLEKCRKGNDTIVCSGRGECVCGVCQCFTLGADTGRKYSGQHCECNAYNCPRSTRFQVNAICGGPTRGRCGCGKDCKCLDGWEGKACDCSTDNSTCMGSNGLMCSGRGTCECGKCTNCSGLYMGPTCEDCLNCPSKCIQYRDCAECHEFKTGKYNQNDCNALCPETKSEDELELNNNRVRKCDFRDSDNCLFHFTYEYKENNEVLLKVQRTKDRKKHCPEEVDLALILVPVVISVVLIPLLLLIAFILIRNRKDAAEFARFMKEKDKARWESAHNPIYRDPKSTFKNPTYKGGK